MIALLLFGCGGGTAELATVEGFAYEWVFFNHRLSYLETGVLPASDAGAREGRFGVVGGTSTTGVPADLPETCDPETCAEFPITDRAAVRLDGGFLVASGVTTGAATADLEAGAAGASRTLAIDLPGARGTPAVAIAGLVIDTDHLAADGIEHCYDPAFGWHPTRIAIALGEPTLDGDTVTVDVSATFAAGNSLEDERLCVDELNEQAVAAVRVTVAAIAGKDVAVTAQDVAHGAAYEAGDLPFDPTPQPDPADRSLTLDTTDAVLGWTAIDYTFHAGDPEGRGAYLRKLDVRGDLASGHATNYSPGTQLSGFSYDFVGAIEAIAVPGAEVVRSTYTGEHPVELDADGRPVVTSFAL